MGASLSAVDSVSPAFADTKEILFRSFRFGLWSRLAALSLLTGEFAGGSWGGSTNINLPNTGNKHFLGLLREVNTSKSDWTNYWPWIAVAVRLMLLLGIAWVYAASVSRFILFDAVLRQRNELRQG